ncbi:Uncharacterised protein [Streptococcus pneumoniae]|nr:Uncharacterised protein [Streptococcus pneumoniae]
MTEIHACLCGNWVNLSADDDCVMGPNMSMYHQDYIYIHYRGADYRIHPMFIQIVSR